MTAAPRKSTLTAVEADLKRLGAAGRLHPDRVGLQQAALKLAKRIDSPEETLAMVAQAAKTLAGLYEAMTVEVPDDDDKRFFGGLGVPT